MLPAPRVAWLLAPILAWQVLLALPVGAQEELCVNAGFEQGTDGWHLVAGGYGLAPEDQAKAAERARVTDTSVHGGKAALLLDATGLDHEVDAYSSPMKVKPNHGYRLTSFVRQLAGDAGYKVTIDWRTADGKHLVYANDWKGGNRPEDYTAHGGVFASPEDAGEAVIILGAQRGVKCVFDDVSLRELGPAEPLDARPRRDGDGSTSVTGPATVAARSHATWTITYTAGQSGLPCGGGLSLRRSERSYDWSQCQSQDPAAAGFVTASGPRDAEFEVRGGWDVEVIVQWPALAPGDQVTIVLGDTSGGGPGTQVQGRPARGIEWLVSSDADADGDFAPVGSGGRFDVVPGQATKAVLVAPATAEVGRPARLTVEVRDEADNVIPAFTGTCRLTAPEADLPGDVGFGGEPGRKDVLCRFTAPGLHELELTPPEGLAGDRKRIVVSRATGPTGPVDEIAGGAVAANEYVRLVIPGNPFGYGYVALYARVGDEWRQVAALPSLGEVWWPGQDGGSPLRVPLYASDVNYGAPGGATRLVLDGTVKTPGGDVWPFTVTLSLVPGARHFEAEFTLTPRTPQPLLAFYGPLVCAGGDAPSAGGGSFGADKRLALLPGLEYLTAGEVSSDDKGVAWPIRERWAPHPYKVTVPLMAVSSDDATVALMWDPTQQWDGSHAVPRPWFASPNRPEARANHLMALFAPFLPDSFEENLPHAAQPWTPPEGAQLRLAASVALLGGQTDVTDAVRYYASLRPLPTPNPPRSYADELALSAIGYLDTGWRDEEKGWIPSIGHEPSFAPVIADQLLQVALLVPDRALADRIRAQVAEGVARHGTPGLELSFRQGDATAGLEGLRGHARAMMNGQHPEGYWTFADVYSMEGRRATLAAPDDVELGTCVNRLQPILRYALVSGDPAALEAGLRGLKYIERFNRPAGSESWEVPLVNPNLRAAALACECYVDAFRLTGDAHYLDRARYWAWSGLSFIYLWEAPDRPVMPGASISVMGTTFYTHPWFGAAVQWVGLVYASTLRYLADYDQSFDWRRVAELITVSAMRQQETPEDKGGHAGYYPDSYHVVRGEEYYDWDLAPTPLIENVLGLLGHEPSLTTALVPGVTPSVHLSSLATPSDLAYDAATKTLSVGLRYYAGQTSQVAVSGLTRPEALVWNGKALPAVDDLGAAPEGWTFHEDRGLLVAKTAWTEETGTLVVRGCEPAPYREPRPATRILNGGFEDGLRGWRCDARATLDTESPRTGRAALRIDARLPEGEVQANGSPMRVEPGRRYRLTAYVRQPEGEGSYKVTVDWRDADGRHLAYDNDWQGSDRPAAYSLHGGVFTAPPGAASAVLILGAKQCLCLMDDITLEPAE